VPRHSHDYATFQVNRTRTKVRIFLYRGQDVAISSLKVSRVYYGLGNFAGTANCAVPSRPSQCVLGIHAGIHGLG